MRQARAARWVQWRKAKGRTKALSIFLNSDPVPERRHTGNADNNSFMVAGL